MPHGRQCSVALRNADQAAHASTDAHATTNWSKSVRTPALSIADTERRYGPGWLRDDAGIDDELFLTFNELEYSSNKCGFVV